MNRLQPSLGREACEILGFIKQIAGVANQLTNDLFDSIWDVLPCINILVVYLEFRASVGLNKFFITSLGMLLIYLIVSPV